MTDEKKENQECVECHKKIVHPDRKYKICLDCFIEHVMKEIDFACGVKYIVQNHPEDNSRVFRGIRTQLDIWMNVESQTSSGGKK